MIPEGHDDASLVRRARAGDHEAYADLVRRHQATALRVARLMGPAEEAEDACQEALVKAYRALGRFDAERPFRPWLLAIVANEARTRGRRARRASLLIERAAALSPPPGDEASAEETALARVGLASLRDALGRLRADERETLILRFVLGLSEHETALVVGRPAGTVKSRTSRGLARLRAAMEESS